MERSYAIMLTDNGHDVFENIVRKIREYDKESSIWIFGRDFKFDNDTAVKWNVTPVEVPEDVYAKESKFHNHIVRYFTKILCVEDGTSRGYLHVIKDNVGVVPEKMSIFVPEIEEFMKIFGYDVWLNTITDVCNYIFDKYIARVYVANDCPELMEKYPKTISWTSNANTNYMVYDLDNLKLEDVLFDEKFSIAMFYIIKFFAVRRNNGRPGSFMNFYPAIPSEKGILKDMKYSNKSDPKIENEKMKAEDKLFREMNIDFHPTEKIEEVLQFMIDKLRAYRKD